ncbi:S41 family peptidase [Chitinophaga japonensis]|nr:S41 family peptidase [Chitinophaga japonensis]
MKPLLVLLAITLIANAAPAQQQPVPAKEMETALTTIAALVKDHYVFKEKGAQTAQHLLSQYRQGAFRSAGNWEAFDSIATALLRNFAHDGHLYVRYGPGIVKELRAPADTAQQGEDVFHYGPDAEKNNFGFHALEILEGNTGYIHLSEINISAKSLPVLYAAMQFVAHTQALVIDLRDNGGGGSEVGAVLESYFLPKDVPLLEVQGRNGPLETVKTVPWLLQEKYRQPLYILVNKGTASAAEALAFTLQAHKRAVIIGQPSAGGAHMNTWYPVNASIYVSISTAAPVLPGTTTSWEQRGVQPDHVTAPGAELTTARQLIHKQP